MEVAGKAFHKRTLESCGDIVMKIGYFTMLCMEGYTSMLVHYTMSALFLNSESLASKKWTNLHIVNYLQPSSTGLRFLEWACRVEGQGNFFHQLLLKKYDDFALTLGYLTWEIALENTYCIYQAGEYERWYVTLLPNKEWAVWKSGHEKPPHRSEAFHTWQKAIYFLHGSFEKEGLAEWNWTPEGFGDGEDIFTKEPDSEKRHVHQYS